MNAFSTAFNRFKKDGFYIILIDFITIFLLIFMVIFLRDYLGGLVGSAEKLGTDLQAINFGEIDKEKLADTIDKIQPIVFRYNLVFYFIFPVILFLVMGVLQGLSFGVAQERSRKIFDKKYLLRFSLYTLPGFILGILFFSRLIELLSVTLLSELEVSYDQFLANARITSVIFLLLIIVGYFSIIAYGMLLNTNIKKSFNEMLKIGIKKTYLFLPLLIAFAVVWLFVMLNLFTLMFSFSLDTSILLNLSYLAIFLAIFAYLKILNAAMVNKYQQEY